MTEYNMTEYKQSVRAEDFRGLSPQEKYAAMAEARVYTPGCAWKSEELEAAAMADRDRRARGYTGY